MHGVHKMITVGPQQHINSSVVIIQMNALNLNEIQGLACQAGAANLRHLLLLCAKRVPNTLNSGIQVCFDYHATCQKACLKGDLKAIYFIASIQSIEEMHVGMA